MVHITYSENSRMWYTSYSHKLWLLRLILRINIGLYVGTTLWPVLCRFPLDPPVTAERAAGSVAALLWRLWSNRPFLAVCINLGGPVKGVIVLLQRCLGLMQGMF